MLSDDNIKQYVRDRDDAVFKSVETDSIEPFKEFITKYRAIFPRCFKFASDDVIKIAVRKMAYHSINLPQEIRDKAEKWLLERGYDTSLD